MAEGITGHCPGDSGTRRSALDCAAGKKQTCGTVASTVFLKLFSLILILPFPMNSQPKTTALFWDNDGVLVDTEKLYFRATRTILASIDIPLTKETYIDLLLTRGAGAFVLAEQKGFSPAQIAAFRKQRNELYISFLRTASLVMDGVEEVLDRLHRHFPMAIVTSSDREHFDIIHARTNLLRYFDFWLVPGDFKNYKPDPEPYLLAVTRADRPKDECIAIEDSPRGLASARAAGIRCIVIPNDLTRGRDFSGAWKILTSIRELPSVLAGKQ